MTAPTTTPTATAVIPYLTATDAVGALAWYTQAFGAEEQFRVVGPDGLRIHYRKLHLFDREKDVFTPGDKGLPVADTPGV